MEQLVQQLNEVIRKLEQQRIEIDALKQQILVIDMAPTGTARFSLHQANE